MPRMPGSQDGQSQWDAPTDPSAADAPGYIPLPLPYETPNAPLAIPPAPGTQRQRLVSPRQQANAPSSAQQYGQMNGQINQNMQNMPDYPPALRATAPLAPANNGNNNRRYLVNQAQKRFTDLRRSPWRRVLSIGLVVALLLTFILGLLALHRYNDFGQAISHQGPFSTQTNYMTGSDRINLLVLGYGGAGHDGAYLTDSIEVISLIPGNHATTLISVPRDLWVQVPPNSGQYAKINTAYADGFNNGYNGLPAGRDAGGAEAAAKVTDVLGIPVTYWLTMDFAGFRSLVDALGGVDINVPTAFTAQYPVNDDPSINPNWKTIHFNAGMQHMNGEQAIEYARARYVSNPVSEGSDFARSIRQQLLIRAILSRAREMSAWPGLLNATDALQNAIYTNLSLTDLALFSQKLDFTHAAHIGLSNQNVLVEAQSSDGQDILLPANGDWNAIQQYVTSNLKS